MPLWFYRAWISVTCPGLPWMAYCLSPIPLASFASFAVQDVALALVFAVALAVASAVGLANY